MQFMIVFATHTLAYRMVRFSPPPQTSLQTSVIIGMVVLGQPLKTWHPEELDKFPSFFKLVG